MTPATRPVADPFAGDTAQRGQVFDGKPITGPKYPSHTIDPAPSRDRLLVSATILAGLCHGNVSGSDGMGAQTLVDKSIRLADLLLAGLAK